MEHSKPKVTIDLDEYNELLKVKQNSLEKENDGITGLKLTAEGLSSTINQIVRNA